MLVRKLAEERKLWQARVRPNLHLTPFVVCDILASVRMQHFPELRQRIDFFFVDRGPLACIWAGADGARIYAHQVLNRSDTPPEVIGLICKHELLHLQIPPLTVAGKEVQHPPEFWVRERAICPERRAAWTWVWTNLWDCLKHRPRLERIDVLPKWRESWSRPRADLATCVERLPDGTRAEYDNKGW